MAPLAGDGVGAHQRSSIDDDTAADAGTQDHPENDSRLGGRAVDGFGQRKAVGIVGQANRSPEGSGKVLVQGLADEPGRVCVLHQAAVGRNGTRHTDPNAAAVADPSFELLDQGNDRGKGPVIVFLRGLASLSEYDGAAVIKDGSFDFCAAEINAYTHPLTCLHSQGLAASPPKVKGLPIFNPNTLNQISQGVVLAASDRMLLSPIEASILAVGMLNKRSRLTIARIAQGRVMKNGNGKTVLVVEDNDLNMKLFHDLLEAHGYRILQTKDGMEALQMARQHRPDLILMDIQLPEVSGLEVTKWIKEDEDLKAIPVVAVTAFAMKGDEEKIREGGCEAYIAKPISVTNFLETVGRFLN